MAYEGIDHAGGLYLQRYLLALRAQGHDVRLFTPTTVENVDALGKTLAAPVFLAGGPPTGALRRATQFVLSGVGADSVRGAEFLKGLDRNAREWLDQADVIDVQWYDCFVYAPMLRRLFPFKVLVGTAHDLLTQSVRRSAKLSTSRPARIKNRIKAPLVQFWESRALRALDHVHVFKHSDIDFIRRMDVATDASVTVPVIETFGAVALPDAPEPQPLVVFVAAFARPENDEAARWLMDEVVPRVLSAVPAARFRFAGSRPPDWLMKLEGPGVEVTGYLNTMELAYRDASCVVVPLHRGAGLKFKTVQAMALGLPVVSTSVGAEGVLDLCGIAPYVTTDNADRFSAAVVQALTDGSSLRAPLLANAERIRATLDFDQQVRTQATRFDRLARQT